MLQSPQFSYRQHDEAMVGARGIVAISLKTSLGRSAP